METGISSGLMGHLSLMQTLPTFLHLTCMVCDTIAKKNEKFNFKAQLPFCFKSPLWHISPHQSVKMGHFTVVCLVTKPVIVSKARGDLALMQNLSAFPFKRQLVSTRTIWIYKTKAVKSVSKQRHLQPFKDQVTRQTTVKWSVRFPSIELFYIWQDKFNYFQ